MTAIGWIQILLYCAIIVAITPVLGGYMTRVFNGERTFLSPILRPVEAVIYAAGGVDEKREQHWVTYTVAMLLFHVGGFLIIYLVLRLQNVLPFQAQLNPAGQSAVAQTALARIRDAHPQVRASDLRRIYHRCRNPDFVAKTDDMIDRLGLLE